MDNVLYCVKSPQGDYLLSHLSRTEDGSCDSYIKSIRGECGDVKLDSQIYYSDLLRQGYSVVQIDAVNRYINEIIPDKKEHPWKKRSI